MEQLLEVELTGEPEIHWETPTQCRFVHHKSKIILPGFEGSRRDGKLTTNRLNYGTAPRVYCCKSYVQLVLLLRMFSLCMA